MKAICLILLSILLSFCNGSGNHPANVTNTLGINNYKPMPSNAQVLLFDDIADSINALITRLDKNSFKEGRGANEAYDPDLAINLVEERKILEGLHRQGQFLKASILTTRLPYHLIPNTISHH